MSPAPTTAIVLLIARYRVIARSDSDAAVDAAIEGRTPALPRIASLRPQ
jgi:hypothetical protein